MSDPNQQLATLIDLAVRDIHRATDAIESAREHLDILLKENEGLRAQLAELQKGTRAPASTYRKEKP